MYLRLDNNILKGQHVEKIFGGVVGLLQTQTKTSGFDYDRRDRRANRRCHKRDSDTHFVEADASVLGAGADYLTSTADLFLLVRVFIAVYRLCIHRHM